MHVPAGKKVAIVGHPGCGKSTLAGLIMRFYELDKGEILINERQSVNHYDTAALRKKIGFVMQDPILFSATIRENIVFGDREASDAKVRQYAEMANALEFIESDYEELNEYKRIDKMRQWLRDVCAVRQKEKFLKKTTAEQIS